MITDVTLEPEVEECSGVAPLPVRLLLWLYWELSPFHLAMLLSNASCKLWKRAAAFAEHRRAKAYGQEWYGRYESDNSSRAGAIVSGSYAWPDEPEYSWAGDAPLVRWAALMVGGAAMLVLLACCVTLLPAGDIAQHIGQWARASVAGWAR